MAAPARPTTPSHRALRSNVPLAETLPEIGPISCPDSQKVDVAARRLCRATSMDSFDADLELATPLARENLRGVGVYFGIETVGLEDAFDLLRDAIGGWLPAVIVVSD